MAEYQTAVLLGAVRVALVVVIIVAVNSIL